MNGVPNDVSCYGNLNLDGCYDCNVANSCDRCGYGYYSKYVTSSVYNCLPLTSINPNCLKSNNGNPNACQAC